MRAHMPNPRVILIDPQMGENIGMVARAMLNCGLRDLWLVNPRDGWPSDKAEAAAVGALSMGDNGVQVRVVPTIDMAVADCQYVYATAATSRDLVKRTMNSHDAGIDMHNRCARGEQIGIVFGPERTGLTNAHMAPAQAHIKIPTNPDFSSLNLSQAVLLVGFAWWQQHNGNPAPALTHGDSPLATYGEIQNFTARLAAAMDSCGFFRSPDMRPTLIHNLEALMARTEMTTQEVRTAHGILSCLIRGQT